MDDLKLKRRSEEALTNKIRIVKTITNDMKRESGLEKCATIPLKKWQGS